MKLLKRAVLGSLLAAAVASGSIAADKAPRVVIETTAGRIVAEVYPDKAPITAGNFLALADKGVLNQGSFYRVVRPDNDNNPATITVIQGGLGPGERPDPLPPIEHETTAKTGLRHRDGALSMARAAVGTASSEFFIVLGDAPALDFGGKRNPDGQGFAAFGQVVEGMDVVRKINAAATAAGGANAYMRGQMLDPPVRITNVRRLP
jgi:peptidyl-prolyl cis-trans isomerase A (cyclophilin A)